MEESFEIPVLYKEQKLIFHVKFLQLGYSYKFQVILNEIEIYFERDDEGNFRAMIDPQKIEQSNKVDIELLKSIAVSLETIFK